MLLCWCIIVCSLSICRDLLVTIASASSSPLTVLDDLVLSLLSLIRRIALALDVVEQQTAFGTNLLRQTLSHCDDSSRNYLLSSIDIAVIISALMHVDKTSALFRV